MPKTSVSLFILILFFVLSGCSAPKQFLAEITTTPSGAMVAIDGAPTETTPFSHSFDFTTVEEYRINASKEGFFEEEITVDIETPALLAGKLTIDLEPSPLWTATTFSPTTNNWIQILVHDDISLRMSWQIMIDAVIKRSSAIKALNYEAGYLETKHNYKKFNTKHGEFLLRCQLVATLISSDPLIYRLKNVSEWSGNGVQWHPYNRVLLGNEAMTTEIQNRFKKQTN